MLYARWTSMVGGVKDASVYFPTTGTVAVKMMS
jgi:hypothetical protein